MKKNERKKIKRMRERKLMKEKEGKMTEKE